MTHTKWVRDVALGGRPLTFGNLEKALPDANVPGDFQAWVAGQFDPSVTWADLAWLRSNTGSGKIALKGDTRSRRRQRGGGARRGRRHRLESRRAPTR